MIMYLNGFLQIYKNDKICVKLWLFKYAILSFFLIFKKQKKYFKIMFVC